MKHFRVLAASLLFLTPSLAYADKYCNRGHEPQYRNYGYNNNSFNSRRNNEYFYSYHGIRGGIVSGRLSKREVADLRDKQRDIEREARIYRSDGILTRREREELRHDIADYREDLHHELNDGEKRRRWFW